MRAAEVEERPRGPWGVGRVGAVRAGALSCYGAVAMRAVSTVAQCSSEGRKKR